ncbi:MAG: ABC transporter ATP-binding protein [Thermodesulfobacteriota bacterium]
MSSEVAIKVENISKCYQVYDKPHDRLKQSVYPRLHRLVGKQSKQYFQEFWALRDVSFEIKKGATCGIIGRNGSGKSTLLQIVCGTLTPTSGTIETFGRVASLLELGAGFNIEFTGRENVYMNASILGLTKEEIDARLDDIIAFADIGEFIDQPVKTYSSGMYVRLAFSVIAHVDADILVVDEALSVGDAFFTQKCMRFLRNFRENGTILFVSHDIAAVVALCQEAFWLNHGSVRQSGSPKEISEAYLAKLYETTQGGTSTGAKPDTTSSEPIDVPKMSYRDMRLDFINTTNLRNDIEVFQFQPNAKSFGSGGAYITSVVLTDENNTPLAWVVGGELVKLCVCCATLETLESPIVGFIVKDRLGQALFGDNTFLTLIEQPVRAEAGVTLEAKFFFQMPILPKGEYSVTVAIADGTQQEPFQHQWIHDAMILKSASNSLCTGLVGVPMLAISMATKTDVG